MGAASCLEAKLRLVASSKGSVADMEEAEVGRYDRLRGEKWT